MKYLLLVVLILGIVISSCAILGGSVSDGKNDSDESFEGVGQGYRGTISVRVRMNGGDIIDIEVLDSIEDRFVGEQAIAELTDLVVIYNSTDIDAVSGATKTSKGFLDAIESAIMKR